MADIVITQCRKCNTFDYPRNLKLVHVRRVFGIHRGTKPVFDKKPEPWCGRCRATNDGKWRYAK